MDATYEQVHAGDIVQDADGLMWGVEHIDHEPHIAVTLVRHGVSVTGYPPAGTAVNVVQRADVELERQAAGNLLAAGLGVEIISEHWESGS